MVSRLALTLALELFLGSRLVSAAEADAERLAFFEKKIRPVLVTVSYTHLTLPTKA